MTLGQGWWLGEKTSPVRRVLAVGGTLWALCTGYALLERMAQLHDTLNQSLANATFGFGLPLFSCWIVDRSLAGRGLEASLVGLARSGGNRRTLALGLWARASSWTVAFVLVSSSTTAWILRTSSAGREAATEPLQLFMLSALGSLCYCSFWLFLSVIGDGRRARLFGLVADWLLGSSLGIVALPWPRHHLSVLLGVADRFEDSARSGALALTVLAAISLTWVMLRTAP